MGFFSNKKKIEVTADILRVIEDHRVPNSGKSAVGRALLTDESLSEAMLGGLAEGVALKMDRMYRWARENYYYGCPHGSLVSNITGKDVVEQVIEAEVGQQISIEYFEYAPANSLHMAWETLIRDHGYDPATNKIGSLSTESTPAYLKDIVAVYTQDTFDHAQSGTLAQWGKPATEGYTPERLAQLDTILGSFRTQSHYVVSPSATFDYLEISYVYLDAEDELQDGVFSIPMTGYDNTAEYYHVKFSYPSASGRTIRYWSYLDGSDVYPQIDDVFTTDFSEIGNYMPNVYFRLGDKNLSREEERWYDPHKSSSKLCKFLGFDYQNMGDQLHEGGAGSNEHLFMMSGVPLNTKNEVEMDYLFRYISLLYYNSPDPSGVSGFSDFTPRAGSAIQIADKGFTTTFSYQGVARRRAAGRLGKVGTCQTGERIIEVDEDYITQAIDGTRTPTTRKVSTSAHYFRKQVSTLMYEEVVIYGAALRYHVYGSHHVVATGSSKKLLMPIDHSITSVIPIADREELFSRALHTVSTTVTITEEKWYANPLVKWVIVVVAIIVTVVTMGGTGPAWAALIAGLAGLTVASVLTYVAIALAIKYGTALFVKKFGAKLGFVAAVIAVAVSVYLGNAEGATEAMSSWSEVLVQVSSNLMDASNAQIQAQGNQYLDDMKEFSLLVSQQQKELNETKALLAHDVDLNPFDVLRQEPMFIPAETPDEFYQRTVHSGNVGANEIAALSVYHESKLRLPTFAETMQSTYRYNEDY